MGAGAYRRERRGPSPMFLWSATLVIVSLGVGAMASIGALALVPTVAGLAALVTYTAWKRRGDSGSEAGRYVGPEGPVYIPVDGGGVGPPS